MNFWTEWYSALVELVGRVVTEKGEGQKSTETWKIHNNLGGYLQVSVFLLADDP